MTPHMSTEAPKPEHLKLDEALLQELKRRNEFEPTEDTNRRCAEGPVCALRYSSANAHQESCA